MKKKHVVGFALGVSSVYVITNPKTLMLISSHLDRFSTRTRELSLYFKLARICVDIVKEHPELHEDPRIQEVLEEVEFYNIVDKFHRD